MARTRMLTFAFIELLVGMCMLAFPIYGQSISANAEEGVAVEPYPNMPKIPPIGVLIVFSVHDQCGHIDLFEVFGEVGLCVIRNHVETTAKILEAIPLGWTNGGPLSRCGNIEAFGVDGGLGLT